MSSTCRSVDGRGSRARTSTRKCASCERSSKADRSGTLVAREGHEKSPGQRPQGRDQGFCGGRDRRRSGDLALFRRALYQLSYPTGAVLTGFEPATSGLTGRRALQTAPQDQLLRCTPNGIRTRAAALKGRCPRPLDDGGPNSGGEPPEDSSHPPPPRSRTCCRKAPWRAVSATSSGGRPSRLGIEGLHHLLLQPTE